MERRPAKHSISRKEFLQFGATATTLVALSACRGKQSKVEPAFVPPLSRLLYDYYPELQTLRTKPFTTDLETINRTIHFFDYTAVVNPKSLQDVFTFFDTEIPDFSKQQFVYTPGKTAPISFWLKPKPPKETFYAVIPEYAPTPNWVGTSPVAASHGFTDAYVSYVKVTGNSHPTSPIINTPELYLTKSIVVEAIQTSITHEATGVNKSKATANANLMQEISPNSLAYAVIGRMQGLPYSEYEKLAQLITIGPNKRDSYPLWIVPQSLYTQIPVFPSLLNS